MSNSAFNELKTSIQVGLLNGILIQRFYLR